MASLKDTIVKAFDEQEELIGTEKQIAWATTISDTKLDEVVRMLRVMSDQVKAGDMTQDAWVVAVRRAVTMIQERRAEWWINHRDDEVHYLLSGSPLGFFRR
jgi:hypothetical protein